MNNKGNRKTDFVALILSRIMYNSTNVIVLHPPTPLFIDGYGLMCKNGNLN